MGQGDDAEASALSTTLERIEERLDRIERRVEHIEQALELPDPDAPQAASAAADEGERAKATEQTTQRIFSRIALACFIFGLALILRTITRQGWLSASAGTALGLAYCVGLLIVPFGWQRRRGQVSLSARMFEYSGLVLAPLIVLETVHRSGVMSIPVAVLVLGGIAMAGTMVAASQCVVGTALTALFGAALGVLALGVTPDGAVWRAGLVVEIVALALWMAHLRSWFYLRPLAIIPALVVLFLAVGATAHREGLPAGVAPGLVLSAVALWVVVAINYACRRARLDRFERISFPLVTLWCYASVAYYAPRPALVVAAALAVALVIAVRLSQHRQGVAGQTTAGLLVTATLLSAASLPWLDRSGLALAVMALMTLRVGLAANFAAVRELSQLLALCAVATIAWGGRLLAVPPATPVVTLLLAAALATLLMLNWWTAARTAPSTWARAVAAISLVGATAVAFAGVRLLLYRLLHSAETTTLGQTLALTVLSAALLVAGRWRRRSSVVFVGLLGNAVLGGKVLLWDITHLDGVRLVASVLALGLAATVTSLVLRNRA